jgi:hypothetical protein
MYQMLGGFMNRIDDRTITKMEIALENACRVFPNGGDHESRKYVAEQLRLSARKGNTTLDGLCALADRLVERLSTRESA